MAQNEEIIRDMLTDFMPADPDQGMELLDKLDILLMRYEAAIREVRTRLEILNDELSLKGFQNPITNIMSRRKSTVSIFKKLKRQGDELSLESIQKNLNDVAGIRVICSFIDDIYKVARGPGRVLGRGMVDGVRGPGAGAAPLPRAGAARGGKAIVDLYFLTLIM